MSRLTLVLLLALAVLAVAWGFARLAPPEPVATPSPRAQRRAPSSRAAQPAARPASEHAATGAGGAEVSAPAAAAPPAVGTVRDLFAYADDQPVAPSAPDVETRAAERPQPAPAPTPTPRPVRLVGFVRQAGRVRAALRVHGEVLLAAPGEPAGEYAVLALDEDTGVRLRGPDGKAFTLRPTP